MKKASASKRRLDVRLFFRLIGPEARAKFERLAKHHGYEMADWNGLAVELAKILYPKLFRKNKKKGYSKRWSDEDEFNLFRDVQVFIVKNTSSTKNSAFASVARKGHYSSLKTAKSVETRYNRILKTGKYDEKEFRAIYRKWLAQREPRSK